MTIDIDVVPARLNISVKCNLHESVGVMYTVGKPHFSKWDHKQLKTRENVFPKYIWTLLVSKITEATAEKICHVPNCKETNR